MSRRVKYGLIIGVVLIIMLGIGLALVKREGLAEYSLLKGKIAREEKRP